MLGSSFRFDVKLVKRSEIEEKDLSEKGLVKQNGY